MSDLSFPLLLWVIYEAVFIQGFSVVAVVLCDYL